MLKLSVCCRCIANAMSEWEEEFPDMKGFSERNIKYVRQWFLFYMCRTTDNIMSPRDLHYLVNNLLAFSKLRLGAIGQQLVAQLN